MIPERMTMWLIKWLYALLPSILPTVTQRLWGYQYAWDVVATSTQTNQSSKIQAYINRIKNTGGVGKIILPASTSAQPIWIGTTLDLDDLLYIEFEGQGNPGLSVGWGTVLRQMQSGLNTEVRIFEAASSSGNGVYYFHDFACWGAWNEFTSLGTGAERHFAVNGAEKVTYENIGSYYCRHMAITSAFCGQVHTLNCEVAYCARDAINHTGSSRTFTIGNRIWRCNDDAIAIHSTAAVGQPPNQTHVIQGNQVEDAFGIKMLGGTKVLINGNILDRVKGYGVYFDESGVEGYNDLCVVDITDNVITNVINSNKFDAFGDQNYGIRISSSTSSFFAPITVTATALRVNYPECFTPISNDTAIRKAGAQAIRIDGNIIKQTLPRVSAYTGWGYGQAFEADDLSSPSMSTNFHMATTGVGIAGAALDIVITNNTFDCLGYPVALSTTIDTCHRLTVRGNQIRRFNNFVVWADGNKVNHGEINIDGNDIDGDPYFESANRDSGNGAKTSTVTIAITSPTDIGWTAHGLPFWAKLRFTTSGALPTGILPDTDYFVINDATYLTNSFRVALYPNGPAVNATIAGSGTHTATNWVPDGTWTQNDNTPGVVEGTDFDLINITNNRIANINSVTNSDTDTRFGSIKGNVVYYQPNSASTTISQNAANAGIRDPGVLLRGITNTFVYRDCLPTSATYDQMLETQLSTGVGSAMPTTGYYLAGQYIPNTAIVVTGGKYITGWLRLTTSNAHTLNTDWSEISAETGSRVRVIPIGGNAKVGAVAGWVITGGTNIYHATLPASQTNSTLVCPLEGMKVGDTITAVAVIGQIESGGNTATIIPALFKQTAAAADISIATLDTLTLAVTSDTILSAANTGLTLATPEVIAADESMYLKITGTTAASTDMDIISLIVTYTP